MTETDKNIDRIIDEAADWFVLIDAGDATDKDKANFAEWLNVSPVHAREYAEISGLWDEAALYGSELDSDQSVVQLFPHQPTAEKKTKQREKSPWADWRKIAASLIVGIMLAGSLTYVMTRTDKAIEVAGALTFETKKGESRRFRLSDDSFVELNTDSRIEVRYSAKLREINLIKGEAFFEVAKNKFKPFIVEVDTTRVRALGTQFNINKRLEKIEVTVLEGKVRVSTQTKDKTRSARQDWVADLGAGEQIITLPNMPEFSAEAEKNAYRPEHLNLKAVLSWRNNKLIFDHSDLIDIVEDFNRYNEQTLILADPELRELKISGTFNPNDPESFVQSMEKLANIRTEIKTDGRIFLYKAEENSRP